MTYCPWQLMVSLTGSFYFLLNQVRTMKHRDIRAKIKQDQRNRAEMGNKCKVFKTWQHKRYLRKNKNSPWVSFPCLMSIYGSVSTVDDHGNAGNDDLSHHHLQNLNSCNMGSWSAREEPKKRKTTKIHSKMMGTLVQVQLCKFSFRKAIYWPQKFAY